MLTQIAAIISLLLLPTLGDQETGAKKDPWKRVRNYPPLVFSSKAILDCAISSTDPGKQSLRTVAGQGLSFDAPMQPIKDGVVVLEGKGMMYKFDAFPVGPVKAKFSGLGNGTVVELKIEVEVTVKSYQQPGGAGSEIRFGAADIDADGAYVEFTGVFVRDRDKKEFPFRILFGSATAGEGSVLPASSGAKTALARKRVVLGTAAQPADVISALYEAEDDVPSLK